MSFVSRSFSAFMEALCCSLSLLRLVVTIEDGVDIDRADRRGGGFRSGTTGLVVPDAITTETTLLASQLATPGQIGSAGRLIGMLSIAEGFDEPICLRNRHSVTLAAILGLSYLSGLSVRALDLLSRRVAARRGACPEA